MNRGDLVEAVAKRTNLPKSQVNTVLDTVIGTIKEGVRKDGEARIAGFGTFKKTVRKARAGVNPSTGEKIRIAKRTVPTFKASKTWVPTKATPVRQTRASKQVK